MGNSKSSEPKPKRHELLKGDVSDKFNGIAAVFMDTANDGVEVSYDERGNEKHTPDMIEFEELYEQHFESPDDARNYRQALLDYPNQIFSTALHLAANNGHVWIVRKIIFWINQDCDEALKYELLNKLNKYQFSPLMSACFRGYHTKGKKDEAEVNRIKIVNMLLENGARADYITEDTKMTSLHWAAYNKDPLVVKALLQAGAKYLEKSHVGRLPIDVAGSSMAWPVVDACLDHYYYSVTTKDKRKQQDYAIQNHEFQTQTENQAQRTNNALLNNQGSLEIGDNDINYQSLDPPHVTALGGMNDNMEYRDQDEGDRFKRRSSEQDRQANTRKTLLPHNVNQEQFDLASNASMQMPSLEVDQQSVGQKMAKESARKALAKVFVKDVIGQKKDTPLKWVELEDIESNFNVHAKAHYLYWACFRGHVNLVRWILEEDQISPFARIYEGRSPLMASLIGKGMNLTKGVPDQTKAEKELGAFVANIAQIEICGRRYVYEKDQFYLENQMLESDNFGNNPLHFAFRSRKTHTVDLIIRAGYGDLDHRNQQGQTPKEAAHNKELNEDTSELLIQFDPTSQRPQQADYVFVTNAQRKQVLYDQLDNLGLSEHAKEYRLTSEAEKRLTSEAEFVLVLVFFTDDALNKEAENQKLKIQLQDKYQTLEFKDAGRQQYQKFKSTERYRLMMSIFEQEFNMNTLIDGGVIEEHFMPHTSKKFEIIESLDRHTFKLIWNFISMGDSFMKHFEPLNLIADYYGEKYALYLAFFLHHIGWICIPALVGTALFIVHLVLGYQNQEEGESYFTAYLNNMDTPLNYFYILFISLWSTFYVESWKRKQATIQYIWGLEEKEEQINESIKRPQEGNEYVYDAAQGITTKRVMNQNQCWIKFSNIMLMLFFSSLAIFASIGTIQLSKSIEFGDDEIELKQWWFTFAIFINSVIVAILTKFFSSIVEYIVKRENHAEDSTFQNSMINKSMIVSSFISFGGLFLLAYWERSIQLCNILMIFLIIFKQILLNAFEACQPNRTYPPLFQAHAQNFKPHCRKFPEDYEKFEQRTQHYEAEQQTLMGDMDSTRTEGFNELIIEFGWICLFPFAFPAAALVAILSNAIQYKTEKDAILKFAKRCEPRSAVDIGKWIDYFETISTLGIINGAGLVIFTSQKLRYFDDEGSRNWDDLVVSVLMIENVLIFFKVLLAALIPDKGDWIEKEIWANKNRVKQQQQQIKNQEVIATLNAASVPDIEFVENCLLELHSDRDLAMLLVRKLQAGANKFTTLYAKEHQQEEAYQEDGNRKSKKTAQMPYKEGELKSKLRAIRSTIEEELDDKSPVIQDEKNGVLAKRKFSMGVEDT